MFLVISGYNVQAVKAIGKSNEVLKLEVFKKPLFLIVVFLAAQHSIMAVALVSPLNALYAMAMNMGPSRRCLGYSFKEQMSDLQASSLLALAVFVATWPFTLLNMNEFLVMFLQLIVGFMVFIGLSKIFKVDSYIYVKTTLVDFHNRTKNRK
jgi:O-antigen/teichoic acid export membrane protein